MTDMIERNVRWLQSIIITEGIMRKQGRADLADDLAEMAISVAEAILRTFDK